MKKLYALLAGLALVVAGALYVHAQNFQVIATCGTLPTTPPLGAQGPIAIGQNGALCMQMAAAAGAAGYPTGATPLAASTSGTTGAVTAILTAVAGKTTYLCGFSDDANATTAIAGTVAVSNGITLNFVQPIAATPAVGSVYRTFTPCVPAGAAGLNVQITGTAAGTAGVQTVSAWGYQL